MSTELRTRLLVLLAAAPLFISTQAVAGLYGNLSLVSKAFPKRDREMKEAEMLVKFKASVPTSTRDAKHILEGNFKMREFRSTGIHHVLVSPNQTVDDAVARYKSDPNVEFVEPNYVVRALLTPNESGFTGQWSLNNEGQTGGAPGVDIDALNAWNLSTGSSNLAVMVIDSGIDYNHVDLLANIWTNPGEIPGNLIDDDNNGYVDDIHGIDVLNGDVDPMDDYKHGTHVAGIIGAVGNNLEGGVGVAWNVKLIPCKILNSIGDGDIGSALQCLEYARKLKLAGVNIVATNNSYGALGAFSQILNDAIKTQRDNNILFIAGSGNSGLDNDTVGFYPANVEQANVMSITATDHFDDRFTDWHIGRRSVHMGAPGVNISSTFPGAFNYDVLSGTSMAAPHVTGTAVLLKAQDPTRDWRAIKNLLMAGGEPIPSLTGNTISGRRLNAFNSLSCTNRAVFSVMKMPAAFTVGAPSTVSALSINCANAVGPVTGTTSAGQVFSLLDNGIAPDQAAGDGIFTATWTPTLAFSYIDFTSVAGTERVSALDLAVTAVSAPPNANRGDVIAVNTTLVNTSSVASPASTMNLYLSLDAAITTSDNLLGTIATPALAPGVQQLITTNVTIPPSLATTNYFVGAIVDPANLLDEGNEGNNYFKGNAVLVSSQAVDLSVQTLSGPTTAFVGDAVALSSTVTNLGTSPTPATTVNFYISSDAVINAADALVATANLPSLLGGASATVTATPVLPASLASGNYFYGAVVDPNNTIIEVGKTNNTRAGNAVAASTRAVDLIMTAVAGPTTAKDGQAVTLTATLKNQGTVAAPASTVQWYLSTDSVITTADVPVASINTPALAAGATRALSVSATVPASVAAGTYRYGVIVDPANVAAETNNTNNTRASTGTVAVSYTSDLVMTAVAAPLSGATGQAATFTGTVKNQGLAATGKTVTVGFYLSSDTTITTSDRLITSTTVPSLAAGASQAISLNAALRTTLTAGTYYVGAIADTGALLAEKIETNNALAGNTMAVSYGPDLVMTAVAAPATVIRGGIATITGTLLNQGIGAVGALTDLDGAPAGTTVRVGFYLSTNSTITVSDRRIGTVILSSVPAGSSVPLSVNVTIPNDLLLLPGTYYIGAIADDNTNIRESNEINNARPGNLVIVQ